MTRDVICLTISKCLKRDRLEYKTSFCYTKCSSTKGGLSFDRKKQTRTLAATHFGLGTEWNGNSCLVL